jgi:hypothetical protein
VQDRLEAVEPEFVLGLLPAVTFVALAGKQGPDLVLEKSDGGLIRAVGTGEQGQTGQQRDNSHG